MRVLGLDPGFATMGYGVVDRTTSGFAPAAFGALKTSSGESQPQRLAALYRAVAALIAEHRPAAVAIERVFFNANVRTAIAVGQASGVALAAAAAADLDVTEYTPGEVKQAVAGVGNAPKGQVQAMVAALLGLDRVPKPPDAADACALAICHINRGALAAALARAAR